MTWSKLKLPAKHKAYKVLSSWETNRSGLRVLPADGEEQCKQRRFELLVPITRQTRRLLPALSAVLEASILMPAAARGRQIAVTYADAKTRGWNLASGRRPGQPDPEPLWARSISLSDQPSLSQSFHAWAHGRLGDDDACVCMASEENVGTHSSVS